MSGIVWGGEAARVSKTAVVSCTQGHVGGQSKVNGTGMSKGDSPGNTEDVLKAGI